MGSGNQTLSIFPLLQVNCVYMCMCVGINVRCPPWLLFTLLSRSPLTLELTGSARLVGLWAPRICLYLPSHCQGCRCVLLCLPLDEDCWNPNSGLHAWAGSSLYSLSRSSRSLGDFWNYKLAGKQEASLTLLNLPHAACPSGIRKSFHWLN